jgi:hypothetical protein
VSSSSTSSRQTWVPSLSEGPTGQPSGQRPRACSSSAQLPSPVAGARRARVPALEVLRGPLRKPTCYSRQCPPASPAPAHRSAASPSFARDSSSFWIWFSKKSIATAKATTASSCNLGGIIILRSPMKPAARDQDIPRGAGSGAPRATEAPGGDPDPGAARTAAPQRPPPPLRSPARGSQRRPPGARFSPAHSTALAPSCRCRCRCPLASGPHGRTPSSLASSLPSLGRSRPRAPPVAMRLRLRRPRPAPSPPPRPPRARLDARCPATRGSTPILRYSGVHWSEERPLLALSVRFTVGFLVTGLKQGVVRLGKLGGGGATDGRAGASWIAD